MKFRYKLARSAKRDLQEISDYWTHKAGQEVALNIITDILTTIITLSGQPRIGARSDQFGVGVRRFPAGDFMIYYRVLVSSAEILHVFHGAQDQMKAWKTNNPRRSKTK
jgi:toxin ParE1/3/4